MEFTCGLLKKTFVNDKGEAIIYYNLEFILDDDETILIPIKSDKAKLLIMAKQLEDLR